MYKALVIDDEKPVRQAVQALGHWEELGIGEIYEAMEGESGLALLREYQPEIVLVDMKMPNMDGVRFLEIASRDFPQVKFIVISGYDDFEYAKQAIKAKVLDYLLKPVVEKELNEALSRAVNQLNSEKNQQAERNEERIIQKISLPLAKEQLLLTIIHDNFKNCLTEEQLRILQCKKDGLEYAVAIFRFINFDEICRSKFDGDSQKAIAVVTSGIDELCREWNHGFSFKDYQVKNEVIQLLAIAAANEEEPDRERITTELKKTIQRLREDFGFYTVAALGGFCPDIESLSLSFKNASEILCHINLLDCRGYVFTEYEIDLERRRESLLDKKELLMYAFESGNLDYSAKIITEYFNQLRNSGFISLEYLRKTVREFEVLLENIMTHFKIPGGEEIIAGVLDEATVKAFTKPEEFSDAVYRVIEEICQCFKSDLKTAEKENLYEIKDYIDKHYFREIKLSVFSNRYYLSKEYLTKLFKEEFGYNIYEYVLKVRMEKARELLSDPEVKVLTVAERLGYKDNNYFSRAFKTYYGISPTEYRERELKQS